MRILQAENGLEKAKLHLTGGPRFRRISSLSRFAAQSGGPARKEVGYELAEQDGGEGNHREGPREAFVFEKTRLGPSGGANTERAEGNFRHP